MKMLKIIILVTACLFTAALTAQWSDDPGSNTAVAVLNGSQAIPKVGIGPNGDVYIGFFSNETGLYDVRLQRYDSAGNAMWEENGIIVSDHPSMTWLTDWDMTVDQQNNAILTFQDVRTGNNDIFAYSISSDGAFNWGEDGLQLSDSPDFAASPKVCVTSDNNVVVTWHGETSILMQKISSAGDLLWGDDGISIIGENTYSWPQPLAIADDEIIVKFFEDSGVPWAPTRHIFAQRFDTNGNPVWDDFTIVSNAGGISAWNQVLSIIGDGDSGFFIGWHDDRDSDMDAEGFVQHINSDGEAEFTINGVEIITTGNRETYSPKLIYDSNEQELTAYWQSTNSDQNSDGITGQKFDSSGSLLWGNDGITLIPLSASDIFMVGVSSSPYGNIVIYEESHDALNSMTKAMLLDEEGDFVWEDEIITLSSVTSQKLHPVASKFDQGQWVATWEDRRDDDGDIYAQNITFTGELGPLQTMAGISGNVIIYEGEGNVEEVTITAGTISTNPDAEGYYNLILDPGVYDITASLDGYETVTEENIEVLEETVTDNVNFLLELEDFEPPYNVQIDNVNGVLTWEHPYVTGEETQEGFELEEIPDGWMNVDSDGDTLSWFLYTYSPHGGSQTIASASWVSPLGALNPDNWLISPALEIGTDSELHFWYAAQDENYPAEHFAVFLSTSGTEIADFTENIFDVTVESNEWTEAVIDLNQYLDETVHLAWRHYDCTNQFYLKIDDIALVNSVTRERTVLADFESGTDHNNLISSRSRRDREIESYNVYLNDELITNTTEMTYTYEGLINGQSYEAGVTAVYTFGESEPVNINFTYEGTGSDDDLILNRTELLGNYPNPFNPVTTISFTLNTECTENVELTIYNIKGQDVKDYSISSNQYSISDGQYFITWDGTDNKGKAVPSGVYFYKLKAGEYGQTRKMLLLK